MVHAAPPGVPIGQDFTGMGISVTSGGEIVVYAGVREIGCKVGVCGAVRFDDVTATTQTLERQFTGQVGFRYKTVEEAQVKGIARCAATRRAWDPGFAKTPLKMTPGRATAGQ
jgi:hypothetical protein